MRIETRNAVLEELVLWGTKYGLDLREIHKQSTESDDVYFERMCQFYCRKISEGIGPIDYVL